MAPLSFDLQESLFPISHINARSSSQSVNAASSYLIEQKRILQSYICALETKQNSLRPIFKLPDEILLQIFSYGATTRDHRWVQSVSHVCHYFRRLSISCPNLWTHGLPSSPAWATEILARARSLPLDVSIVHGGASNGSSLVRLINVVLSHLDHIQHLTLHIHWKLFQGCFRGVVAKTPLLESLAIKLTGQEPGSSYVVPSSFVWDNAPRLRHLILSGCTMSWISRPTSLASLDSLEITKPVVTSVRPSWSQLLSTLQTMHGLRTLHLENTLPSLVDTTLPAIDLPQLRFLKIGGNYTACAYMLSHIRCNENLEIKATCDHGHLSLTPASPFITFLGKYLMPWHGEMNIKTISFQFDYTFLSLHSSDNSGRQLSMDLTLGRPRRTNRGQDWGLREVLCITELLDLTGQQALELISPATPFDRSDKKGRLRQLFCAFPALSKLFISAGWTDAILDALSADDMTTPVLPLLKDLRIDSVSQWWDGKTSNLSVGFPTGSLLNCVVSRLNAYTPLENVSISPNATPQELEALYKMRSLMEEKRASNFVEVTCALEVNLARDNGRSKELKAVVGH